MIKYSIYKSDTGRGIHYWIRAGNMRVPSYSVYVGKIGAQNLEDAIRKLKKVLENALEVKGETR